MQGRDELDAGVLYRDVVAHGTLRHHQHTRWLVVADVAAHRRGRAHEIRFREHVGRTLWVREDRDPLVLFTSCLELACGGNARVLRSVPSKE